MTKEECIEKFMRGNDIIVYKDPQLGRVWDVNSVKHFSDGKHKLKYKNNTYELNKAEGDRIYFKQYELIENFWSEHKPKRILELESRQFDLSKLKFIGMRNSTSNGYYTEHKTFLFPNTILRFRRLEEGGRIQYSGTVTLTDEKLYDCDEYVGVDELNLDENKIKYIIENINNEGYFVRPKNKVKLSLYN